MKFLDKIKDLFSDEEEVIETKEIKVEEEESHQLPTFMRNKIEEEKKEERKEEKKVVEPLVHEPHRREEIISDREIVKTRSNNNFSFPIQIDEDEIVDTTRYSKQNILLKEKEKNVSTNLYSKKEEPKPKKFKPTPVISPVYGVLDKNYTKDEVKVQDENSYEIQRSSRKIDFETVRNKAFGSLTDDIRNNLCENCELYQEVKITKNADRLRKLNESNLLSDMTEESPKDISLGSAEENYFDFGVSYEAPKKEIKQNNSPIVNDETDSNDIKIINHNEEESKVEKIEVKEEPKEAQVKEPKEVKKSSAKSKKEPVLEKAEEIPLEELDNDIFNLIDSMYEEEK